MTNDDNNIRGIPAIAARLISVRTAFGMSQSEFADTAGIARNTYNQYEKAVSRPSMDNATKLRDTYGLTLDFIMFGDASSLKFDLAQKIKSHQ